LIKKLSDKDKKVWTSFIESDEKLEDKDKVSLSYSKNPRSQVSIDLHGYSLEEANKKIFNFINECFDKNVEKINIITGKGSRSKNQENPYQSNNLGILKYSVPDFIQNNKELMHKILSIDLNSINSPLKGDFNITLKKIKN
tara:strand:+ start:229 stop:651 length:423 start_codon:yes stop_codon:yes gene_type:complete